MRVVFLRSNPVSPDSRVEKQVNTLLDNDYDVQIFAWDRDNNYNVRKTKINVNTHSVKISRVGIRAKYGDGFKKNIAPLLKFQTKMFIWLVKNRREYDIIHACDFDTGYVAKIIARIFKKKLVYDIFDFYVDAFHVPNKLKKIIKKREFSIINRADATIICTEERKQQINGAKPIKLEVIHNTPPKFKVNKLENSTDNKLKIGYVGVLGGGRLILELVDIVEEDKDLELHIGGFGKYEELIKEKAEKNSNIYFYGRIPYEATLKLESSVDIMTAIYDPAIPNHYYAAPNKFYEGLMLGKPLIMVENTGMSKILEEYEIGETIDYNKESLKKALNKFKKYNKTDFSDKSLVLTDLYEQNFSWETMEKRLVKLYKGVSKK